MRTPEDRLARLKDRRQGTASQSLEEYYNKNRDVILPIAAGIGTFGTVAAFRRIAPRVIAENKYAWNEAKEQAIRRGHAAGRKAAEEAIALKHAKVKTANMYFKAADNLNQISRPIRRQLPSDPEFKQGVADSRVYKHPKQKSVKYKLGFYKGHYLNKSAAKSDGYDFEPADTLPAVGGAAAYAINRKLPLHSMHTKGAIMAGGIGTGLAAAYTLRNKTPTRKPLMSDEEYAKIRSKDHWSQKALPGFVRKKQLETEKYKYGEKAFADKYSSPNHNMSEAVRKHYTLKGVNVL